jgi:dihydrofolate synthase / folylpolyglutamate synthase
LNYTEALQFLTSRGNEVQGIHLGLHRIRAVMQALGEPQRRFASIHIAGTNGKGSVAAMTEAILRQGGWRTGLYTSPHLVHIEERIHIAGRAISRRDFAAVAQKVREIETALMSQRILDRTLTYFEFVTACGFLHFAERAVDIAVVEVGLGGRLDATNVICPQVSVITGISYDHQKLLGNTLTKIAAEKAGIIKPGVPVASGCRQPSVRRVVLDRATANAAPVFETDRYCTIESRADDCGRYTLNLKTPRQAYPEVRLALAGEYQVRNAAVAITALEQLAGYRIAPEDVRRGLAKTHWPGRLDEYRARRRTLLDGAHNAEGARLLREHLLGRRERSVHLVFGAARDKDIRKITATLFPLAQSIHLAPLDNPRSAVTEKVAAMHEPSRGRIQVHGSACDALAAAWRRCPEHGLVVVTGSLYLVGELLPPVRADAARQKRRGTRRAIRC